jgi:dihydroxyacetone kinase
MSLLAGLDMLTTERLAQSIVAIEARIAVIRDELNAADRHLGDGDTGMTVAQVVAGWSSAAAGLPPDVGAALLALGRETSRATGSSLGAVFAMGLGAAGRAVRGTEALSRGDIVKALSAAVQTVSERSGATAGDKCVLDSLLAIERRLAAVGDDADLLKEADVAAQGCLLEFRNRESKLGRARMYGAKSIGQDDPGMLAVVLLLAAVRRTGLDGPAA